MNHKGLLKRHASTLVLCMRLLDWSLLAISSLLTHALFTHQWQISQELITPTLVALFFASWVMPYFNVYDPWRGSSKRKELLSTISAISTVFLCVLSFIFMTEQPHEHLRTWLISWFILSTVSMISLRLGVRSLLNILRKKGLNQRYAVIIGEGQLAHELQHRLNKANWTGIQVQGLFADSPAHTHPHIKHLGSIAEAADYIYNNNVDQVLITLPLSQQKKLEALLEQLKYCTADIRYIPEMFSLRLLNQSIGELVGLPVLNLSVSPMQGLNRWLKALEDRLIALAILIAIAPIMLVIAIGVKLSSKGPMFYRQERVSWNGKSFYMLKFRSMPVNSEAATGAVWAQKGENRATPFGAFLRKTSLDELPQFLNVLMGDMSIVGPRPERPVFVEQFKQQIPGYMQKHMVKAGITGWAQINGWRGNTDLQKRIEHDLYYIDNWSLWFDLKIIFLTLFKGFIHQNAY